jgi:AcrR family transcriptional regulator
VANKSASESAATRQRIVETARRLFAAKGFAATTTREIVQSEGLTEGAFFHHFKDKKALFATVVESVQREFAAEVFKRGSAGSNAFERFVFGAKASLELSQKPEYLRLVLIEAPTALGGDEWRRIDSAASLSVIEPALAAIAKKRDIPPQQLRPMALQVLGLLNETAFALSRDNKTVTVDDVITELSATISDWIRRLG